MFKQEDNILQFEGVLLKYTAKFISKNLWKYTPYYSTDDLMQEARIVHLKMITKYGDKVQSPAHFMSLYKSSLGRRLIDLSNDVTAQRVEVSNIFGSVGFEDEEGEDFLEAEYQSYDDTDSGLLDAHLEKAPEPVRAFLAFITNAPESVRDDALSAWSGQNKKKGFGNNHICRLLGYDPSIVNIEKVTQEYILGVTT